MKNAINYYYNMNTLNVYIINQMYYYNYNNIDYFLVKYTYNTLNAQKIYQLNNELKTRKILTNDIIVNRDNQIITYIDNTPYILIKDNTKNNKISLNDILYFQNSTINIVNNKNNNDWIVMWQQKIDYYEEQISMISKKSIILFNCIDYYIGLGENAISYLKYNIDKKKNVAFCYAHRRINIEKGSFDFYNPLNYVIDNRVRDFVEYTKQLFFLDYLDFDIYKYYLDYMNYDKNEYVLLISRLLFPSYFFDLCDEIIINNLDDSILNNVINRTNDYIILIKKIILYIVYQKGFNIPFIDWIIKDVN